MSILLLITLGSASVIAGRWIFGRWFNPLSLYTTIWTGSLSLFELRLLRYYDLEPETWVIIADAWLSFALGCITLVAASYAIGKNGRRDVPSVLQADGIDKECRTIESALWLLNVISFLVVLQHWYIVLEKFGSIQNVIVFGNILYSYRVSEGLPGTIPYLDALALTGSLLAGVYTALTKKFRVVAMLPPAITVLSEIASMGRAKILIAALLFFTGYFHGKRRFHTSNAIVERSRIRRALPILAATLLLVVGAEFVRSNRGAVESLPAATQTLKNIRGFAFITPSIYLYLTVHHGVFNQYLKRDEEHTPWGSNTFAPLYRLISKFGFDTFVPDYMRFYATPVGSNTGSYLKELHADFGLPGIFIFPYLLGLLSALFWYKFEERRRYVDLAVLAHLLLIVMMSFFINVTRAGHWVASLIATILVCYVIDRRARVKEIVRVSKAATI